MYQVAITFSGGWKNLYRSERLSAERMAAEGVLGNFCGSPFWVSTIFFT